MRKIWWIILSLILLIINIFLTIEIKKLKNNPFSGKIIITMENRKIYFSSNQSLLTLIIYFSHRSSVERIKEVYYWNKLYKTLPKKDITIIGLIPGNEEIKSIKTKYKILFPVYCDKNLLIVRRFLISITPFKIIMDKNGKILHMSPAYLTEESHKNFYFTVLELLKNKKIQEQQVHWK